MSSPIVTVDTDTTTARIKKRAHWVVGQGICQVCVSIPPQRWHNAPMVADKESPNPVLTLTGPVTLVQPDSGEQHWAALLTAHPFPFRGARGTSYMTHDQALLLLY